MKRILLLLLFVLPVLVSGQRLKIGKQLEKAPGINYMVLTDINGEQYYTPMSSVLGSINTDQSLGTVTLSGNNLVITERNVLTGAITATYTINLAPYMQTLTAVDNGNGTLTLNMTGDPSPELIDICNIVSTHCNTDLTVSPTGLVTFTDNAGNNFSFNLTSPAAGNDLTYNNGLYFDETVTALSYNPTTHALSYVNEAGATNTITLDVAGLTFNAGTNTLTYTAENGVVTNIVLPADVVTTITNTIAGNRIATYTNENGVAVDIDETITTIVNNGDGTYTYTNEAGATATFPAQANTDTRLSLSVVNDSLRVDVVNIVTGATVSTSYIDNVINHPDVLTTLAYNSTTHTLTYTDENGGTTNLPLDVATMTYNPTTNTITYTAENGTVTNITLPVETVTTIINTVTGHKIADYTNELGAVVPINETVIGTTNNPDGSITITKEDGTTFTSVPVAVNGSGSITAVEVSPNVFNLAFKYDCDSVLACIPADIDTIVTDFDIVGNTASITLSSGHVLSATITHPADSTVLTTANTNIVVTETSPNTWELEFVYNCDSIKNCLADIQLNQYPIIVSGDTVSYVTQIIGPKGEVVTDTITIPAQTITTITGTQSGHTIATYTNEIGTTVGINETIIDVSLSGNTLTITDESGTPHNVPLPIDSTVVTSANSNIIVTETSPNAWSLNFTYDCDSITNCLSPIQMIQTPVIMAGDTIGYETEITGPLGDVAIDTIYFPNDIVTNITNQVVGHKIADYTNENGIVQPINETITAMLSVSGGAGAPDTLKYTNEAGITNIVSPIIYGARNNLQLGSPIVERGNVNLGGGQPADFIRNTYNWLGANYQDKWQSSGDANLFDIKANQTINSANTTNSGAGAVNIGTLGASGQYKLNVHGALWLDNGTNSQFIGNQAGQNNAMPIQIGIGTRANMNSSASLNDAIGFEALMTNTTGSFNTCFGNQSMRNANGYANIGLGFATLYFNQGAYNVAIGNSALQSNVSGSMNFALGYNSMVLNNSGARNIGIGYSSLYSTNNGWQNIGIGAESMQQNISGNNNVAIGDLALQFNTTSSNNTTIGIQSQRYGTGYWNVGVGNLSQLFGKNCNYNTSLGGSAMFQNRYASNNVALGYESMYALNSINATSLIAGKQYEIISQGTTDFTLVGSADNNVGTIFTATGATVGTGTTASITDIPNNNTAVGYQSLYATQGFTGNVALGYQAGYNTTGNNRLYIENSNDSVTPLIGGDFAKDEVIIGGVQKFSIQYPTSGTGVSNGSIFYGTDGALYFKGGSGTVTMIAPN